MITVKIENYQAIVEGNWTNRRDFAKALRILANDIEAGDKTDTVLDVLKVVEG